MISFLKNVGYLTIVPELMTLGFLSGNLDPETREDLKSRSPNLGPFCY